MHPWWEWFTVWRQGTTVSHSGGTTWWEPADSKWQSICERVCCLHHAYKNTTRSLLGVIDWASVQPLKNQSGPPLVCLLCDNQSWQCKAMTYDNMCVCIFSTPSPTQTRWCVKREGGRFDTLTHPKKFAQIDCNCSLVYWLSHRVKKDQHLLTQTTRAKYQHKQLLLPNSKRLLHINQARWQRNVPG